MCNMNKGNREECVHAITPHTYLHPDPPLAQTFEVELLGKTSLLETQFLQLMQLFHGYVHRENFLIL